MKELAYAKVNLALNVIRRLDNGYHDLEMIMAPIELSDELSLEILNEDKIIITCTDQNIPTDERNIVYKVAKSIKDKYNIEKGFKFHINKKIPSEAGLAGGSSDGACALRLINNCLNLNLANRDLVELSKNIGADIPFCIYSKPAVVKGIGEKIELINTNIDIDLLLIKPSSGVSTKEAYQTLDLEKCEHPNIQNMKKALEDNNKQLVIDNLSNSLEQSAFIINKDIEAIKHKCKELGFENSLMSGSGSTVFAISKNKEVLERGYNYFKDKYPFVMITKVKAQ